MNRFLHVLQAAEGMNSYLVAGRVWKGRDLCGDELRLDLDGGVDLKVEVASIGEGFKWQYCKEIAPTIFLWHYGSAASVEEACRAALGFNPECMTLEYLDRSYIGYGRPGNNGATFWTFAVDGERIEVSGPFENSKGVCFRWRRDWLQGKELLERFCDTTLGLGGQSQNLMEALIAAVDAPELFKRACGKLIASLERT